MTNQPMNELSVWFIDDNEPYLETCRGLYGNDGYKYSVRTASSVDEAMALVFSQDRPAVVLMDFDLGGEEIDGAALLAMMLADSRYPLVPAFVSGYSNGEGQVRALEAGGIAYFIKPVPPDVIRAFIENVARKQLKLTHRATQATRDHLTGLFNQLGFYELALQELRHAIRKKTRTACIRLDLDKLKHINDTLGHQFGNKVLRSVADCIKTLAHVVRRTDVLCRVGGDEFDILLPATNSRQARMVANHIELAINNIELYGKRGGRTMRVPIVASTGVASVDFDQIGANPVETLGKLVKRADAAMYKVKNRRKKEQRKS